MVSETVSQGASGQGRWHFRNVTWFLVGRVACQAAPNNTSTGPLARIRSPCGPPRSIAASCLHTANRPSSADMEGPAVKWFGMACWISQSMLRFAPRGREGRAIPEDAGARLTMERLRRRIRLICAGCSEEPSRMTPLRRELPLSRGASRPDPNTGRRIADARTLQSCSHRAVANAARESRSHYPRPLLASVTVVTRLAAGSRVESWRPR